MKDQRTFLSMKSKLIKDPTCIWISSPHNQGDFVAKIPFIRILKIHFPNTRIIVAARSYVRDLVDLIEEVDLFIDFEVFFNRTEEKIIEEFKSLKIDVLVHILSLQNHIGPDVIEMAKLAGVPHRIGNIKRSLYSLWAKRGAEEAYA